MVIISMAADISATDAEIARISRILDTIPEREKMPIEGERHNFIMNMATRLRWVLDFDPKMMTKYIPICGLPLCEYKKIINDAIAATMRAFLDKRIEGKEDEANQLLVDHVVVHSNDVSSVFMLQMALNMIPEEEVLPLINQCSDEVLQYQCISRVKERIEKSVNAPKRVPCSRILRLSMQER